MLSNPSELLGIEDLWNLIMINESSEVVTKALEFLNNLYTNFDSSISAQEEQIKKNYYQQSYKQLEISTQEADINSTKIDRCIMIIENILDESEKKGNGGLKSLISLSGGELISLHI